MTKVYLATLVLCCVQYTLAFPRAQQTSNHMQPQQSAIAEDSKHKFRNLLGEIIVNPDVNTENNVKQDYEQFLAALDILARGAPGPPVGGTDNTNQNANSNVNANTNNNNNVNTNANNAVGTGVAVAKSKGGLKHNEYLLLLKLLGYNHKCHYHGCCSGRC